MNGRAIVTLVLAMLVALPALARRPYKRKMHTLKHIVLDPGHGGDNHGTPGAHGVHEKYLTLPMALELERLILERTNAKVTVTRRTDEPVGLRERTRLANRVGADVFLSIHCNASERPEARGLEVYFLSPDSATEEIAKLVEAENGEPAGPAAGPAATRPPSVLDQIIQEAQLYRAHEQSQTLAATILHALHGVLKAPRRGVFQAPFAVLKEATMPAVVVEVGFSTHAVEGRKLTTPEYQKRIASGLFTALLRLDRRFESR